MDESKETPQRFYGYPKPVEAPTIPYKKSEDANPVFSGPLLVVGAWLYVPPQVVLSTADIPSVSKLGFVQSFLWSNAGFDTLRSINLDDYTERWDVSLPLLPQSRV